MMDDTGIWLCLTGILIGAGAAVLYYRQRERKLLEHLSLMLDQAVDGVFTENEFDETMLSALESRMAHFLGKSRLNERKLSEEQNRIKTLVSDISHQTKTPIANLVLYTELLEEKKLSEDSRKLIRSLRRQVQKLRFLVDNLVKLSRLENGILQIKATSNEIRELMESVYLQVLPEAKKKGITLSMLPGEGRACFDQKWTGEALFNLVDNAVKYTPEGGQVCMRLENLELFSRIDVTDTGAGLEEEEQAKIFERFYRSAVSAEQDGLGIGLYLAREIAAAQGGYIRVQSELSKGSCFSMYLPRQKN